MRTWKPIGWRAIVVTVAVSAAFRSTAYTQTPTPDPLVERTLETMQIWEVLGGMHDRFVAALTVPGTAPAADSTRRLLDLAAHHFADSVLYGYVVQYLMTNRDSALTERLAGWLFSDWAEAFRREAMVVGQSESLRDFVFRLRSDPPSPRRLDLIERFTEANHADRYYTDLEEAVRCAARRAEVAEFGMEARVDTVPPLSHEEVAAQLDEVFTVAALSYLQRFESVSDDALERMVLGFESESGQWYVQTCSAAIVHALERAGSAIAGELLSPNR
jgi:hypothetical protein